MDGERIGATLMLQLEGESEDELDEVMEAVAEQSESLSAWTFSWWTLRRSSATSGLRTTRFILPWKRQSVSVS